MQKDWRKMMSLNVNPQARDIAFEFNDSCNCCCFKWKDKNVTNDTPVYFSHLGYFQKFDFKKNPNIKQSMSLSIRNIKNKLDSIAIQHKLKQEDLKKKLENRIGIIFSEENPPLMTFSTLEKINKIVEEVFHESEEEKSE